MAVIADGSDLQAQDPPQSPRSLVMDLPPLTDGQREARGRMNALVRQLNPPPEPPRRVHYFGRPKAGLSVRCLECEEAQRERHRASLARMAAEEANADAVCDDS